MTMTVGQLKELLEDLDVDDDTLVYIGHQPSWPLCFGVAGVTHWAQRERECPDHEGYLVEHDPDCLEAYGDPEETGDEHSDERVLWIVLSDGSPYERSPYAPRWLWDEGGWR